ncbi:Panacea domain-containing protein [Cryptosporangium sp. NPDC048952]|uniref:Panacea domain-containing protein n=1 Tax=Cryptosporangium sp. NPDC048952 TaxID=3363961 RepID=UPI003714B934
MTTTARDVAAALCERLPGLDAAKMHALLYYAQGHQLAMLGRAMFSDELSAWDRGPTVASVWGREKDATDGWDRLASADLTTIEYVVSRYGGLTAGDLQRLAKAEPPWKIADAARRPGESVPIRLEWLREFFSTDGSSHAGMSAISSAELAAVLAGTRSVVEELCRDEQPDQACGAVTG